MIRLIEPLKKVVLDDTVMSGEEVKEELFGGFCTCGGWMFQKIWIESETKKILISECEKCWKNEAIIFNSLKFETKQEVKVIGKHEFVEFLKEILSNSEIEAIINKARNREFHSIAYSNAKKKLLNMNFKMEEVLEMLR